MIRVIVQRRRGDHRISFIDKLLTVKKAFNIGIIKAFIITRKLNARYGVVINTHYGDKNEAMQITMEDIQGQLHRIYDTRMRLISDCGNFVPVDSFKPYLLIDGYTIFIASKPGFVDDNLKIF